LLGIIVVDEPREASALWPSRRHLQSSAIAVSKSSKNKRLMTLENSQDVVCGTVNLWARYQQGFWNAGLGFQFGDFSRVKHGLGGSREVVAWSSKTYLARH
jgi:hypothetical protein